MGQRVVVFDDLDGTEDGTVQTHRFSFEGVTYRIDLSVANWAALFKAVEPFLKAARPDSPGKAPQGHAERRTWAARRLGLPRHLALVGGPQGVPAQQAPEPAPPTEAVPKQRAGELPADALPMSGGFGDYKWTSDGTMHPRTKFCTAAERSAAMRWVYAHKGKAGQFSTAILKAFRAEDARMIPGWAEPPAEEEVNGSVGKALVRAAEKKKRARNAA